MGNCLRNITWRVYRSIFIEGENVMVYIIIIGMALVTMIPRFLPAFIINKFIFKEWVNHWLQAIPYAALGALIFHAILEVKEGAPQVGLISFIVVCVMIGFITTVFLLII